MILALIDHNDGKVNKVSLEMLTLARGLAEAEGMAVEAVVVGEHGSELGEALQAYGVSTVHWVQHARLTAFAPEAWAESLVQLAKTAQPQAIVAPGTPRGNEVMAYVGAKLNLPMSANCTEVKPDGGDYLLTRTRWGGSLLEDARLSGAMKLFTVAPLIIEPVEAPADDALTVNNVTPELGDNLFVVQVQDTISTAGDKVTLAEARVIVSGGRGVGSAEGFESLEELASLLNGTVGCSRVVTSKGWRPHTDQVGQTGTRVAPDVYIACGISGAIQHIVGCKGSKNIIVINTDPEAPLLAKAQYGVIADLHQVIPAITEEIKRVRGA